MTSTKQIKVSLNTYRALLTIKESNQTFDQAISNLITQRSSTRDLEQQLAPLKQQINLILNQLQILQLTQLQMSGGQTPRNQTQTMQQTTQTLHYPRSPQKTPAEAQLDKSKSAKKKRG